TRGFGDYESLELLLTYAIPRRDVKSIAKALIARFGSLSGVMDAGVEELQAVAGIGPRSAPLIPLVKELCVAYMAERMRRRDLLSSPKAVVDFAKIKLAGAPREQFMAIFLNVKNEVIDHEVVHEGTVDRAAVYPRRIVDCRGWENSPRMKVYSRRQRRAGSMGGRIIFSPPPPEGGGSGWGGAHNRLAD
ncbi:MAG: hypothetical protein NT045_07995, partial [Candidatus Aureabacteria bacterium]|nr:hypothetical protein [Candidatus Auribacterota bacterium]